MHSNTLAIYENKPPLWPVPTKKSNIRIIKKIDNPQARKEIRKRAWLIFRRIELDKDNNLVRYELAKDWSLYDSSIKEMFSEEAYKALKDAKYTYINDKTLLEQAEEYFGVTIIPENEDKFECKFFDKLRYYNPTPEADEKLNQTNDLHFDYIAEDNWNNTIYFGSDWNFETKGSWDEWQWTRTFGQNENTIIVLNNNLDHVYDRYIITNQTENSLNTILEIIQRR